MIHPARLLMLLGCVCLAAGCGSPVERDGPARAAAEARLADLERLATGHASEEGLEGSFASRDIKPSKVIMHDCVVLFTLDRTTVAASECEINRGTFTFRGTPVLKNGNVLKLGDQVSVITMTPNAAHHYEVSTAGHIITYEK